VRQRSNYEPLTDVGELLAVSPAGAGLALEVEEGETLLVDLGTVLDVGSEELGRRSSLFGSLCTGDGGALEGCVGDGDGRGVMTEGLDNLGVHGLDGGLLRGSDGGLRVDEVP
jgi:hypothetical protein